MDYWFYTLSAIPQVLAAIFAVVATFVIFKMNHIQERISSERENVRPFLLPLHKKLELHQIDEMSDEDFVNSLRDGLSKLDSTKSDLGYSDGFDALRDQLNLIFRSLGRWDIANAQRVFAFLKQKIALLDRANDNRNYSLSYLSKNLAALIFSIGASLLFLPNFDNVPSFFRFPVVTGILIITLLTIGYSAWSVWKVGTLRE